MEIFVPSLKDTNPYLDEILNYTKNEFIFDDYQNFKTSFQIVNIQWPESLFDWKEPTEIQLKKLEEEIKKWKNYAKLVYTFHDERNHFGMTPNYHKLFDLIESHADSFIHLGEMSKIKMEKKYPRALHCLIPHPLYINSFQQVNKIEARQKREIDPNALVIFAPGRIRTVEERKMLLTAFKSVSQKNKVLISNNMLPFIFKKDFKGRTALKKFLDVNKFINYKIQQKYRPPKYIFNYGFLDSEKLAYMTAAADLIFIPRIDILNSGNIFLGLTYRKVIVGPAIGNIKEILLEFNLPLFDPHSKTSVKNALQAGIQLYNSKTDFIDEKKIFKFHPEQVAIKMDEWFEKLNK